VTKNFVQYVGLVMCGKRNKKDIVAMAHKREVILDASNDT